jgi:hypothetical protein
MASIYGGLTGRPGRARIRCHEAPARTRPDARPAPGERRLVLAVLRSVPPQRADKVYAAYPAVGRRHVERQATALRTVHQMRRQGRDATASGLGR